MNCGRVEETKPNTMDNAFYSGWDIGRMSGPASVQGTDHRTPFEVDRDRVIYTSAFRRLQAKTQVFLSGEYDFYRTRLTHSIEVAQIGRSVCGFLRGQPPFSRDFHVDPDLVEGVCLAHDLGHPPFGHAGERTLHRLMRGEHGGFEGNAQSLRLVADRIYGARPSGRKGMDATRAFLDGILKYKTLRGEWGDPENHFLYDSQDAVLDFVFGGRRAELPAPGRDRNAFRSIECQIMDWADDTAYSLNDVVDSVRAGFLRIETIEAWAAAKDLDDAGAKTVETLLSAIRGGRMEAVFGRRVGECVKATSVVERSGGSAIESNRYRFELRVEETVRREVALYKRMAFELVFRSAQIQQLEHKGDFVLGRIFEALAGRYLSGSDAGPRLLPEHIEREVLGASDSGQRARLVCDYLAGMTDGFAVRTYKRLFDPDYGSISDLA